MSKKSIGYTTGVFDLFHIGHLNILEKASCKCDYLIVGVTSCETVKSYKGSLPIIPLDERVAIVKALKFVDKVVVQESMDKLLAWEKYKFDVLFHGSDWKDSEMYNEIEKELKIKGVDLVFFEYTTGASTTKLKKIIYEEVKRSK
ncbi:adenylyltransferase/cytidyltransferase family protein [Akkermansiaceae bacterium]|nr:adenylyltransferase/cytidyltransferase family protein [Akkermansiaceae bacterium]MDB4424340.1 adenylyltransferase/cytidyltransferase family protein [Akkermansiaceae bacterium]MDC0291563.1 adenylyltransferase/cytidyltransferase family protein [Akkermansiaceae bacterium]